jgi:hypothetical protein
MNKLGAKIVLWGLVLGMLIFTAIRTLHFLMATFPPGQEYVAFLALAAFDVGVLGWTYFATNSAEGVAQRTLSYGMIFVCAAGVILTTVGDMIDVSAQNHLTQAPDWWLTAALWGVIVVIVLNVLAGILVHLLDPGHQRHLAQETARDEIHRAALAGIRKRAGEIAPQIAERVTLAWQDQVIQEMTGHLPPPRSTPAALPVPRSSDSEELDEEWVERVNARIEQERARSRQRSAQAAATAEQGDEVRADEEGDDGSSAVALRPKYRR